MTRRNQLHGDLQEDHSRQSSNELGVFKEQTEYYVAILNIILKTKTWKKVK